MEKIIGHENVTKNLKQSILNNSFSHTYLFLGAPNVGKFTTALAFAKNIICENKKACDECLDCRYFENNSHPDILIFSGIKKIKIEDSRQVKEFCSRKPYRSSHKVVIIDMAERLTNEAANSLLKVIEEPEGRMVFIFTATEKDNLLQTIVSRCQSFNFNVVSSEKITNWLLKKGAAEKEAARFAKLSLGKPGLAERLLEGGELNDLDQLMDLFNVGKYYQKFDFLKEVSERGDIQYVLDSFLLALRDILLIKEGNSDRMINLRHRELLFEIAQKISIKKIIEGMKNIKKIKETLGLGVNTKLYLENLALTVES